METRKDLFYRFKITTGEITPTLWTQLQTKLKRPVVSALIPPGIVPKFTIPVKHLRGFSGTQGMLEIGDEYIIYKNGRSKGFAHLALQRHHLRRDHRTVSDAAHFHGSRRK